ncbi:tyrosine-type recombinase/integrase [Winogradskyella sediminis]|uniref:tyrosine-type recombinase/integrase n=1 Tax=Winogradskyella sediminis TaxID=1382466 RepID=UPI003AA91AAA
MASINYLYRSTKENAPLTIRLLFREDGKDYVLGANSKLSIYSREELIKNPKLSGKTYWNKTHYSKRIKDIDLSNKQNEINTELNKIENYVLDAFEKINPSEANKKWLQRVVDEYYNPNLNSTIPNRLIQFIDHYLDVHKDLKYGTSKKYGTLKSKLLKREDKFEKTPILLRDINNNFQSEYKTVFADYNANTISRDLGLIKTLCRYAFTVEKEISKEVLNWKFKLKKTSFVYLNEEEIEAIAKTKNLPEYLDNARDWLLISCYVGQRVSDFMRFKKSMIRVEKNKKGKEVHLVEFTQVKTNTTIAVPLHKKVLGILEKRNGDFPRQISDQKYNDYIKDVCQEAELTQKVKGSKMNPETIRKDFGTYEKWELVSSHIGRRSFASNNFGKIPTRLLMSATGHTKEEMFLKYIGKSQTEQAKELADYF